MSLKNNISKFKTAFDPLFEKEIREILREQEAFHEQKSILDIEISEALLNYSKGGKRIRPFFVSLFSNTEELMEGSQAHHACLAIELFQTAALIHDDIIDNDDSRRGVPTIHTALSKRGKDMAILLGDIVLARSLYRASFLESGARDIFFTMVQRTIRGQHLDVIGMTDDINSETWETVLARHELKTAYYTFVSPIEIGLTLSNQPETLLGVKEVSKELGILFQIRDDIHDYASKKTGKKQLVISSKNKQHGPPFILQKIILPFLVNF